MHECLDSIYFPPDSFAFLFFCPINYAEMFGFNFIASVFSPPGFFAYRVFLPLFSRIKGGKKTRFRLYSVFNEVLLYMKTLVQII